MKRREFIKLFGGAAAASPLNAAWAQRTQLSEIGFISGLAPEIEEPFLSGFRRGLMEVGYTEGQNVAVEYRSTHSHFDQLPALIDELVGRHVAAIVSTGGAQINAAVVAATKTIPVIFITGTDPVKLGWVRSLNQPGGNVTGVSFLSNGLETKRLGLLHDTIPNVMTVGILLNPENPTSQQQTKDLNAARTLGLTLQFAHIIRESDIELAVSSILQSGARAVAVATEANFISWRDKLLALTARSRVPAIFHDREFAVRGGTYELWCEYHRGTSARRYLCGTYPQGRQGE